MIIKNAIIILQPGAVVDVDKEADVFDYNTVWSADAVPENVLSLLAGGLPEGDAATTDNAVGVDGD